MSNREVKRKGFYKNPLMVLVASAEAVRGREWLGYHSSRETVLISCS